MFDWLAFFNQHNIEFAERGPNVAKGYVTVHCPFCGADDPSMHMSVNLSGRGWRCWRQPGSHRGGHPARLIQALIGCSFEHAHAMVSDTTYIPTDFLERVQLNLNPPPPRKKAEGLRLPDVFKSFKDLPSARPYIGYLARRRFDRATLFRMTKRFDLRYCTTGPFKGRVIFPVTCDGQLVTWTGRTIYEQKLPRYKTLSADAEKASEEGFKPAVAPISDYLLFHDELLSSKAQTIVLCEGPFDALRIWYLGEHHGIVGTCFFTAEPSRTQIGLLHHILPRFKIKLLMLDRGTLPTALRLKGVFTTLGVEVRLLPTNIKDPGLIRNTEELLQTCALNKGTTSSTITPVSPKSVGFRAG